MFSIQFHCLADWNKALHHGLWEFRGLALIMAEYDGFSNPLGVKLYKVEMWSQIHKLPDGVLGNPSFIRNLAKKHREIPRSTDHPTKWVRRGVHQSAS